MMNNELLFLLCATGSTVTLTALHHTVSQDKLSQRLSPYYYYCTVRLVLRVGQKKRFSNGIDVKMVRAVNALSPMCLLCSTTSNKKKTTVNFNFFLLQTIDTCPVDQDTGATGWACGGRYSNILTVQRQPFVNR